MTTRAQIVDEARSFVGAPWRHQGRSMLGLDCVGLLVVVCRALGIPENAPAVYDRQPTAGFFLALLVRAGAVPIRVRDAQPGDVLAFRDGAFPCHVGIISTPTAFIHAYAQRREVCEEPLTAEWLKLRIAAFAFPGVV